MVGTAVSKTGLIASPKKKLNRYKQPADKLSQSLSKCAVARPVQFSLRPFGGLFNPYAKGCSILCNHPGPNEVKNVVKQVKEMLINEGKGQFHRDDMGTCHREHRVRMDNDIHEHIPEELFRRYAGSDSRPLTPTPTVISGRTRVSTSSHVNTRRCFTPDPLNNAAKERKQLILDLRRSHSQETLYWNASSDLSPALQDGKPQPTKNLRFCEQEARKKSAEKAALQQKQDAERIKSATSAIVCINESEEMDDDENEPRRRGKKPKKKEKLKTTSTFQVSQEPETQIATIGPDSPTQSNRPSLIPNENIMPKLSLSVATGNVMNDKGSRRPSSYITEDSLKYLRRGLNIDVVEGSFERYMNTALKEAYRTIPPEKINYESDALKKLKDTIHDKQVDNEKWLTMPRKYTRNSARFSLPINTYDLAILTPFQYVSRCIWISAYRKQLYNYVFTKYLPESSDEYVNSPTSKRDHHYSNMDFNSTKLTNRLIQERKIPYGHLVSALDDVLGFHGTPERISVIIEILQLNSDEHGEINFRSWSGIVAFSERFLNKLSHEEDPCDEIEIADFESLERKFSYVNVPGPLKNVLNLIKNNNEVVKAG